MIDNLPEHYYRIGAVQIALVGRKLQEAIQRDKMNVVVVGIQREQGAMEFNPLSTATLHAGDDLIVLGNSPTLKELERAAK